MKSFICLAVIFVLAAVSQSANVRQRRATVEGVLGENDKNRLTGKFVDEHTSTHGRPFHESSGAIGFENKQTGLGATLQKDRNSAGDNVFTKSLTGNFPLNDKNSIVGSYGQSQMKNDFSSVHKTTGTLGWENSNGHGLAGSVSRYSGGLGKQGEINGYTNLYKSASGNTVIDANAGASKWLSGPYSDQRTNYNVGITGRHFFRG